MSELDLTAAAAARAITHVCDVKGRAVAQMPTGRLRRDVKERAEERFARAGEVSFALSRAASVNGSSIACWICVIRLRNYGR